MSIQLGFPHLISRQSITYRGLQLLGHHFFLGVAEWAVLLGGCSQWSTAFAFLRALQCHIGNKMTEGKRLSKTLQPYKKKNHRFCLHYAFLGKILPSFARCFEKPLRDSALTTCAGRPWTPDVVGHRIPFPSLELLHLVNTNFLL